MDSSSDRRSTAANKCARPRRATAFDSCACEGSVQRCGYVHAPLVQKRDGEPFLSVSTAMHVAAHLLSFGAHRFRDRIGGRTLCMTSARRSELAKCAVPMRWGRDAQAPSSKHVGTRMPCARENQGRRNAASRWLRGVFFRRASMGGIRGVARSGMFERSVGAAVVGDDDAGVFHGQLLLLSIATSWPCSW